MTAAFSSCASAAPFSVATPGLATMAQEEAHFYSPPADAMRALGSTPVRGRVGNAMAVYEEELERARRAQGGFLNTTLSIFGLLLPISGTVGSIALSDPDHVQTVSIIAGGATTAIMLLNLVLKPEAKSAAAARCAAYLESALEAYRQRYTPRLETLENTQPEWNTYMTMRATLEPGRAVACER